MPPLIYYCRIWLRGPDRTLVGVIKSSIYSARTPRLCVLCKKGSRNPRRRTAGAESKAPSGAGRGFVSLKGCDGLGPRCQGSVNNKCLLPALCTNVFTHVVVVVVYPLHSIDAVGMVSLSVPGFSLNNVCLECLCFSQHYSVCWFNNNVPFSFFFPVFTLFFFFFVRQGSEC